MSSAQLLRLATAGSVDDGKSTLVGRLLHDTKAILVDQLAAVERASHDRGHAEIDLSLLTDGLRAEREQGITIDVAYRYFATPRRKFVLADTPGHVQYTRNTVTGMSTAQAAVVLVDARHGIVEQTRRHLTVAALLRVPHVVLAVNKMDLVDFDEVTFKTVAARAADYAHALGIEDAVAIPVSALLGDNVVTRSESMRWYLGPSLLEHLETLPVHRDPAAEVLRFPVQYVIRADGARWYAGQIGSGMLREGDDVVVLPSGQRTRVAEIGHVGTGVEEAFAPMSVALRLTDELDVSRGDLLVHEGGAPTLTQDVEATLAWLGDRPLRAGDRVLVKHGTRTVRAVVRELRHRLDVETLQQIQGVEELRLNDVGRVIVRTAEPLPLDDYRAERANGSFLVIDEADGSTLAAGLCGDGITATEARCNAA